jgi:protein TonB
VSKEQITEGTMRGLLVSVVVHAAAIAGVLSLPPSSRSEAAAPPPPPIREWPAPVARVAVARPRPLLPSRGAPSRGGGGTPAPRQAAAQTPVLSDEPPVPEIDPFAGDPALPIGPGAGATGPAAATGAAPEPTQPLPTLVRAHVDVLPPRKLSGLLPAYPALARVSQIAAVVQLECTIDADGGVRDLRVVKGHPLFDAAALAAVRTWRYTPTRLNGVPVAVLMTVTVNFTLAGR